MIKIRYLDLPAGLHARVEARGGTTVIYLLPGLSVAQRRAALQRARRSASMGYGPVLPAGGVAVAVMRDRLCAALRNGAAAVRAHPALLLPLIVVLIAVSMYVMTAAVTINIPTPQAARQAPQPGVLPNSAQPSPAAAAEAAEAARNGASAPTPGGAGSPTGSPSRSPRPGKHGSAGPSRCRTPSHSRHRCHGRPPRPRRRSRCCRRPPHQLHPRLPPAAPAWRWARSESA